MSTFTFRKPAPGECSDYFKRYTLLVEGDNPVEAMEAEFAGTLSLLQSLSEDQWMYRYAEGKWSIKEVILHIIDTERIMTYRALRIARNDKTPLPGFEQDLFTPYSEADIRSADSLIREFQAVRSATVELFRNFTADMWVRIGTASDNPISPLALAFIVAGHEMHHMRILRERYLL